MDVVEIKWGDSLTSKINKTLSESKYFLAIISKNSIIQYRLNGEFLSLEEPHIGDFEVSLI